MSELNKKIIAFLRFIPVVGKYLSFIYEFFELKLFIGFILGVILSGVLVFSGNVPMVNEKLCSQRDIVKQLEKIDQDKKYIDGIDFYGIAPRIGKYRILHSLAERFQNDTSANEVLVCNSKEIENTKEFKWELILRGFTVDHVRAFLIEDQKEYMKELDVQLSDDRVSVTIQVPDIERKQRILAIFSLIPQNISQINSSYEDYFQEKVY